jgi:mono/diheme cytochrome c family protein
MLKRVIVMAAAAGFILAAGYADQSRSSNKVTIPVERTNPTDGKQMYSNYCAPCHGADGRGSGPVAGVLKSQPTDLTALAKAHGGKFPDTHVMAVLQFGSDVPAHGTAQMPVWGPILGSISNNHTQEKALRMSNLSRYLQSIQAR